MFLWDLLPRGIVYDMRREPPRLRIQKLRIEARTLFSGRRETEPDPDATTGELSRIQEFVGDQLHPRLRLGPAPHFPHGVGYPLPPENAFR